jgi:opine dehydrogenase
MTSVAVLGAGNGGLAAVADLVRRGHQVALWNRSPEPLDEIKRLGGVHYAGCLGEGFAPLSFASTSMNEVIESADVALVCLPATAHRFVAAALAPHLHPRQIVLLNPGGLLGSLHVAHHLRADGYVGPLRIAETATLSYICRKTAPASVAITSVAVDLPFAALPGSGTAGLMAELRDVLPELRPAPHVLAAGIASINTVLHPPGMILGAAWIEHTRGDFAYYADTAVPSVARLMASIDEERLAIAQRWGIPAEPFLDVFARIGSTSREAAAARDFRRALEDSVPNRSIRAPQSLDSRYLNEDIPFGIVPLADLGRAANLEAPLLEAVITITSTIAGRNFRNEGRTLAGVGLGSQPFESVLETVEYREP